jgi:hypothetical protein
MGVPSLPPIVVIVDRLIEFFFRCRMKREVHFSSLAHIFSKTFSPETTCTAPDLNSASLRLATAAHFLSISDSG